MHPGFGQPLDFAAVRAGVDESGFQLLSLEAELRGAVSQQTLASGVQRAALEIEGSGQQVWILEGRSPTEHEAYAELERRLEQEGATASLRGEAAPDSEDQSSVVLLEVRGKIRGV